MPYVRINNTNVFYEHHQPRVTGGTILFIHGSGGSHKTWYGQINSLPAGFSAVVIDLPAHGQSEGVALNRVKDLAGFIKTVLEILNLPRPLYIAGHSLGAAVTLYLARYYPALTDGIILIGGGARLKVHPLFLNQLKNGTIDIGFIKTAFAPSASKELMQNEIDHYKSNSPQVLLNDLTACNTFDLMEELHAINKPALIIVGSEDTLTPVKYSEFLHQNLAGSKLTILENAGHFVMQEKAYEVNLVIAEFVREGNKG